MSVLVLGSGIIGLSSSILLSQKGYKVTIWAKDLPPNTTSNKAAAVWYPFLSNPPDKVARWSHETMTYYLTKDVHDASSGVIVKKTLEFFKEPQAEEPFWKDYVPVRRTVKAELAPNYVDGFVVDKGVVADTDVYLDYLLRKVRNLGIQIVIKEVKDIEEAFAHFDVVVNCTGLGSRELFKDSTIFPTRGQTVVVKNKPQMGDVLSDDDLSVLAYIVPRTQTTVLGGTAQENDWNTNPSQKDTEEILRKAKKLSPHFENVEIVQVKVGLRPTRPVIRVEPESFQGGKKLVVHNYGHGGSGFTVAWGCAREVVDIVENHNHKLRAKL